MFCFSFTGTDLGISTLGKGGALSRTGKTDAKAPGVRYFFRAVRDLEQIDGPE